MRLYRGRVRSTGRLINNDLNTTSRLRVFRGGRPWRPERADKLACNDVYRRLTQSERAPSDRSVIRSPSGEPLINANRVHLRDTPRRYIQ